MNTKITTIDAYFKTLPKEVVPIMESIRKTIQKEAPDAIEAISYGMPTFKLNGKNLVHFAAWKEHIGFYATPSGNIAFEKELSKYEGAKGSVQFPLKEKIPLDLIAKIAKYRVREVEKTTSKSFFIKTSAPAQRALEGAGITSVEKLAKHSEKEVMELHGMGPSTLPKLKAALKAKGLSFQKK